MSSPQPDPVPPVTDDDLPPHLAGVPAMRPIEGAVIHVRIPGKCQAAMVVGVHAEDPLSAIFTVDAVVFVPPPPGGQSKWEKPHTRPGSVRWANNMQTAPVSDDRQLTWHYASKDCLPAIVLEMLAQNGNGDTPS